MLKKVLDIARNTDAGGRLHARVQHPHDAAKLGVLDDAEGPVTPRAPQG